MVHWGKVAMDLWLEDMRVLVTAGAAGIGYRTALAFAEEGARVHVCDVDAAALARINKTNPDIGTSLCDVSDRDQVARLFDEALGAFGGLDCLVNNAGIAGPTGPVEEIDPAEWDACLAIDLTGQFNCTRLAVAPLKASDNPSIVNLSSAAGKFGFTFRAAYSAAKWGVIGFTKSIARELGPFGIRVNAVLPGIVEGERIRQVIAEKAAALGKSEEDFTREWLAMGSVPEMVTPDQIADQITYLASPRARTISGQAISVDADLQALL